MTGKYKTWFYPMIIMGIMLMLTGNCKKESDKNSITDIEGNVYKTVTLGTQTWIAENLKTTRYNNGTPISNITADAAWELLATGAYCWYNNDISKKDIYGALYNWHAVNTGKLCPTGWHVPTDDEWTSLTNYLGGENVAGGKLKEEGTAHWVSPNDGATNQTGFAALPGGLRGYYGPFYNIGEIGNWWSSTEEVTGYAWCRVLWYDYAGLGRSNPYETAGYSVRCLKDN
jgi:uncharacterized protein (TIGR02145 family)